MEISYSNNLFIDIIKIIDEIGSEGTKKESQEAFKQLQNQALIFVETIENEVGKEQSIFEDIIRQVKKGTHYMTAYTRMYTLMNKDKELTQKIVKAQEKFQMAINKFQNIIIGLIYINTDTGKIIAFSEIQMAEIYENFIEKGYGRGNVYIEKHMQQIEDYLNSKEREKKWQELENLLNKRSDGYINILNEAVERWQNKGMYYKQKDKSIMNTFYWWNLSKGLIKGISKPYGTRGFIAEGYLRALFEENPFSGNLEDKIEQLNEYVKQGDNTGAVFQQDIVKMVNDSRVDLAIKSGPFFSSAKIGQYLRTAVEILSTDFEEGKDLIKDRVKLSDKNKKEKIKEVLDKIVQNKFLKILYQPYKIELKF